MSLSFEAMTVEALTALVCLHLSAGKGEARFESELTLKLPIEGLPEDRDAQISRSIIKDRASFLRYLQCLLGSVGEQLPGDLLSGVANAASGAGAGRPAFASGLLEQLLRALHEEPGRLRGLKSLLERTADTQEGEQDIVPEEFRALWAVIEPHLPQEEHA